MHDEETQTVFMREALAVARRSFAAGGGPFGAVIAQGSRIIATGMSLAESLHDPTAHAEVLAVRAAALALERIDLSDCVAYSSAEPCTMCLSALYWSRISTVYYGATWHESAALGFEDLYIYEDLTRPAAARIVKCQRVLQDEALSVLTDAARARPYKSFLPPGWRPT